MTRQGCCTSIRERGRRTLVAFATLVSSSLLLGGHPDALLRAHAREVIGQRKPTPLPAVTTADLRKVQETIRAARKKVLASCVVVLKAEPDGTSDQTLGASGTIIRPDGLILSHCHGRQVPGTAVRVLLGDGRTAKARYLGVHRDFDMSLIQIEEPGPWPAVEIASGATVAVGDFCFSLAYPGSYFPLSQEPLMRLSRVVEVTPRYVNTGMPLRSGDSGGPLFNEAGQLIGLHKALDGPTTFHTRADLLFEIRDDLLNAKLVLESDFRQPLDRTQLSGLAEASRDSVVRVLSNGDHVAMGLIVGADGAIVTKASELRGKIVCRLSDGRRLDATVRGTDWRHDLALLKVEAVGLAVPPWSDQTPAAGMIVATVGSDGTLRGIGTIGSPTMAIAPVRGTLAIEVRPVESGSAGVVVKEVANPLTRAVLRPGDLITHADGVPIRSVAEFEEHSARLLERREAIAGTWVELTVQRGGEPARVQVPIESLAGPDDPRTDPRSADVFPAGHGRHSGYPAVFAHDALAAQESPGVINVTGIQRSDLGGPVVDSRGKVVGINIGTFEGNLVYAIPANVVRKVVSELRGR